MLKQIKYIILLFAIFVFLIYLNNSIHLNYQIKDYNHNNKLPFFLNESYNNYQDNPCNSSETMTSLRSCFQEYLKGKQIYINDLEKSTNGIIEENTRDIKKIQIQLDNINNNINEYQKDIGGSIIDIKDIQNNMYRMVNDTTELIQNAENAKNKIQQESDQYQ